MSLADLANAAAQAGSDLATVATLVVLEQGTHEVRFSLQSLAQNGLPKDDHRPDRESGGLLPAIQVLTPPCEDGGKLDLLSGLDDQGTWFAATGGTIVVKVPPGGGALILNGYGATAPVQLVVETKRLGRGRVRPRAAPALSLRPANEDNEIVLHIERSGDQSFTTTGWVGNRGLRLRVEAFSILRLKTLRPADIEYKAFGPNGRETPWVSDATLCGTRGRSLPLTGFAVRLAMPLRDRFDVAYEGSFFDAGICGPRRNGEPCVSPITDDPLEAINLRLIERAAVRSAD